ncbi:MAG TPA: hypothetical protein VF614_07735 [Chthoniobacteraceae bacterium]|jgi:hypothetical protein
MPANRRRHANAVPLASIATWIVVAAFICAAGLGYVYCKNQLHSTGQKIKGLERELSELVTQNEVVRSKIASLSSRAALQRRVSEGFIKLVPIERIVQLNAPGTQSLPSEIRAVSNQRIGE